MSRNLLFQLPKFGLHLAQSGQNRLPFKPIGVHRRFRLTAPSVMSSPTMVPIR